MKHSPAGEHSMQLFDDANSLVDAVTSFVHDGLTASETVLVVTTRDHWYEVARRLRALDVRLDTAVASGQLTFREAEAMLSLFMRSGAPESTMFDETIGTAIGRLCSGQTPLRVYGEMVDLLVKDGNAAAAHRLELLWNALLDRHAFTLFCGYTATHFSKPYADASLGMICHAHSCVRSDSRDRLGSALVTHALNASPRA